MSPIPPLELNLALEHAGRGANGSELADLGEDIVAPGGVLERADDPEARLLKGLNVGAGESFRELRDTGG